MIWDEAEIIVARINQQTVTEALLLQTAVASILSKSAGKQFNKLIKGLSGG